MLRLRSLALVLFSIACSTMACGGGGDGDHGGGGGDGGSGGDPKNGRTRIERLEPNKGPVGTEVKVYGVNFAPTLAANLVYFNGTLSTVFEIAEDLTWIRTRVPLNATTGKLTMAVNLGQGLVSVDGPVFEVNDDRPVPGLSSLSPAVITLGSEATKVVVTGFGFVDSSKLFFAGAQVDARRTASTSLEFTLTPAQIPAVGSYDVQVINDPPGGGESPVRALKVVEPIHFVAARPLAKERVLLTFDRAVNVSSTERTSYFSIAPALEVRRVSKSSDPLSLELEIAAQVPGTEYVVTINNAGLKSTEGGLLHGETSQSWRAFNSPPIDLVPIGREGCGASTLSGPGALAVAGTTLYVTEESGNQIQLVDLAGEAPMFESFLGHRGTSNGGPHGGTAEASGCPGEEPAEADALYAPRGAVGIDPASGEVFVADTGRGRLVGFAAAGWSEVETGWDSPVLLAYEGGLLIFTGSDDKIHRVSAGTDRSWGQNGPGLGRLSFDTAEGGTPGLVIDRLTGTSYVTEPGNHRVQKINGLLTTNTTSGGVIGKGAGKFDREQIGVPEAGEGKGEFTNPNGIALDREGFLYVTDQAKGGRVQRFTSEGEFMLEILLDFAPGGVAVDADNVLWVSDPAGNQLHRFQL